MSEPIRTVTDAERRARLGIRHALSKRVSDPLAAAAAVVCLHATEPTSVYLVDLSRRHAGILRRADLAFEPLPVTPAS